MSTFKEEPISPFLAKWMCLHSWMIMIWQVVLYRAEKISNVVFWKKFYSLRPRRTTDGTLVWFGNMYRRLTPNAIYVNAETKKLMLMRGGSTIVFSGCIGRKKQLVWTWEYCTVEEQAISEL